MPKNTPNRTMDPRKFSSLMSHIETELGRNVGRRGVRTRSEPEHYKYGRDVHWGRSRRRGPHFVGLGNKHVYKNKVFVGGKHGGRSYRLSRRQRKKVERLFALRNKMHAEVTGMNSKTKLAKAKLLKALVARLRPLANRKNFDSSMFALGGLGGIAALRQASKNKAPAQKRR